MGNCWPSAAPGVTPASTSGTFAAEPYRRYFKDTRSDIVGAQFARSGYLLATSSWDGTTRFWDGVAGAPLAMAPGNLTGSFSADDRRLAFTLGGKVGVWDVAVASECRTLHPGMLGNRSEVQTRTLVHSAAVSPDGRILATGDWDGVTLWEPGTGRELAHLKAGLCDAVLFQPDGQSLISSSERGSGLYRWPIRPDPDRGPDALCIGPPELLREMRRGRYRCGLATRSKDAGAHR